MGFIQPSERAVVVAQGGVTAAMRSELLTLFLGTVRACQNTGVEVEVVVVLLIFVRR